MSSRCLWIVLLSGLLVLFTSTASAERWGHEREGFTLGFSLGLGSATLDPSGDLDSRDNEGGGAAAIRLGYAFNQNWVLVLGGNGWSSGGDGGTTTVTVSGIGVTWFPQGRGFYLRALLGASRAEVEFDLGPFDFTSSIGGTGGSLSAGHEWRLTRTFALGPELTLSRANFDDVDVGWISANVALNWYF